MSCAAATGFLQFTWNKLFFNIQREKKKKKLFKAYAYVFTYWSIAAIMGLVVTHKIIILW